VTALIAVPPDADAATIVGEAEALWRAGAATIVARSTTTEPLRWLEQSWAPAMPALAGIGEG